MLTVGPAAIFGGALGGLHNFAWREVLRKKRGDLCIIFTRKSREGLSLLVETLFRRLSFTYLLSSLFSEMNQNALQALRDES